MQMTNKEYLMINKSTNIVENICVWDGNNNTWTPPSDYLMLVAEEVKALIWQAVLDNNKIIDYVLIEKIGIGSIGFTWDGLVLTTNQPKPEIPVS